MCYNKYNYWECPIYLEYHGFMRFRCIIADDENLEGAWCWKCKQEKVIDDGE